MNVYKLLDEIAGESKKVKVEKLISELVNEFLVPEGRATEASMWMKTIGKDSPLAVPSYAGLKRISAKDLKFKSDHLRAEIPVSIQDFYEWTFYGLCKYWPDNPNSHDTIQLAKVVTTLVSRDFEPSADNSKYLEMFYASGCEIELVAQATYDYFYVAIPSGASARYKAEMAAFVGKGETESTTGNEESGMSAGQRQEVSSRPMPSDIHKSLAAFNRSWEDLPFVAKLTARDSASQGGKFAGSLVFLDGGIVLMPGTRTTATFLPTALIDEIQIGSDLHTQHMGFSSQTTQFWTITLVTNDYKEHKRWIYLGKNESEMNENRPEVIKELQHVGQLYRIVDGESWQTEAGTKNSMSIGFGFFN